MKIRGTFCDIVYFSLPEQVHGELLYYPRRVVPSYSAGPRSLVDKRVDS